MVSRRYASRVDEHAELPMPSKDHLAREAEARRILDVYGDDLPAIVAAYDSPQAQAFDLSHSSASPLVAT